MSLKTSGGGVSTPKKGQKRGKKIMFFPFFKTNFNDMINLILYDVRKYKNIDSVIYRILIKDFLEKIRGGGKQNFFAKIDDFSFRN